MEQLHSPQERNFIKFQSIFALILIFVAGLKYIHVAIFGSLTGIYLFLAQIIFIVFHFYFKAHKRLLESRIFLLFCIWLWISRVLNDDKWLLSDFNLVFENFVLLCVLPTAGMIPERYRKKMLCVIAIVLGTCYSFFACCGIYSAINYVDIYNILCPGFCIASFGSGRLSVCSMHPNVISIIFCICIWLLIYLFFAVKNKALRILCVVESLLMFCALALTYSRNSMLAMSVSIGLLAARLILNMLKGRKIYIKAICLVLSVAVFTVACYSSAEKVYGFLGSFAKIENRFGYNAEMIESLDSGDIMQVESEDPDSDEITVIATGRGFEDTGRLKLYPSCLRALGRNPAQLVIGNLSGNIMDLPNLILEEINSKPVAHPHNLFLYTLLLTGVPGFLLILGFLLLLLKKILCLYFCEKEGIKTEHRILVLPLCGYMLYNMLETSLLYQCDLRALSFMFIAGAVIAWEEELCK